MFLIFSLIFFVPLSLGPQEVSGLFPGVDFGGSSFLFFSGFVLSCVSPPLPCFAQVYSFAFSFFFFFFDGVGIVSLAVLVFLFFFFFPVSCPFIVVDSHASLTFNHPLKCPHLSGIFPNSME